MRVRNIISLISVIIVCAVFGMQVYSEQITTVAIVDIGEIYAAFPQEARGFVELNSLKEQYQTEINELVAELDVLKREKLIALQANDYRKADNLDIEITHLKNYIDSLSEQRQNDLIRRSKERVSKAFLERLQSAISFVAEERGFTLVLQNTAEGLQWWSPVIDITQAVILRLKEEL